MRNKHFSFCCKTKGTGYYLESVGVTVPSTTLSLQSSSQTFYRDLKSIQLILLIVSFLISDTSESENSVTSQSYNTTQQTTSIQESSISYNTTQQTTFIQESSTFTSNEESSSIGTTDNVDLVNPFYNDNAGKSNITNATGYDQYGNPIGSDYDLCRDGAYTKFNILIAQLYADAQFNDAAMKKPIDALKVKGFQIKHVKTENECITELASNRYQIAWIISTDQIRNSSFISALTAFHSAGGAIFLFADNIPYVRHASEFLKTKFNITVEGNYPGQKTLTYQENGHQQKGHFGQHKIFTGITSLYEGHSICHPVFLSPESRNVLVNIATSTDGNSNIAVYDPSTTSNEGRLCLDCGFTKLYVNWNSAGTARYIVNVNCWLLGMEKRLKP